MLPVIILAFVLRYGCQSSPVLCDDVDHIAIHESAWGGLQAYFIGRVEGELTLVDYFWLGSDAATLSRDSSTGRCLLRFSDRDRERSVSAATVSWQRGGERPIDAIRRQIGCPWQRKMIHVPGLSK